MRRHWGVWTMLICLAVAGIFLGVSAIEMPTSHLTYESRAVEGSIAALHLKSPVPTMRLSTGGNQVVDLTVDLSETMVLFGNQVGTLGELAHGQRVKVYYTTANGKEVATSIVVRLPAMRFPPPAKESSSRDSSSPA
ncbi:MAG: hypothetical protein HYZ90_01450 [Candidatus Omnitrophica bacterium]|nr:hypothetical protein [Candidatus Omnitrophota bacterium]